MTAALAPFEAWLQPLFVYAVASLAIGVVIAAIAGVLTGTWKSLGAASRYAVWYVALIAVIAGPLAPALALRAPADPVRSTLQERLLIVPPSRPVLAKHVSSTAPPRVAVPPLIAEIVVATWLVIALAGLLRFVAGVVVLARLKRDALPVAPDLRAALPLWRSHRGRTARLCVSDRVDVPVAIGLFDAMVVLPQRVLSAFDSADVDRFVLHELAHLERRDDWTTVVQRLTQTLLFFNPAVHVIARRLDLEREIACDDRVIATTSDVRSYAVGLTRMAETTAWPHRGAATPAIFVSRKQLSVRVEELLARGHAHRRGLVVAPAVVALVWSLGVIGGAASLGPVIGVAPRDVPGVPKLMFLSKGMAPIPLDAMTARIIVIDRTDRKPGTRPIEPERLRALIRELDATRSVALPSEVLRTLEKSIR